MTAFTDSAIRNLADTSRVSGALQSGSWRMNRLIQEYDSTAYTTTSTYTAGFVDLKTWTNITGLKGGSWLELYYHIPCRNDFASGWGGLILEVNISFNGGTFYYCLGNNGFDAVMESVGGNDIHYSNNMMFFNPGQAADYQAQLKFRFCTYDGGTLGVNESQGHNINAGLSGYNSNFLNNVAGINAHLKHYMHYSLKEWIQEP